MIEISPASGAAARRVEHDRALLGQRGAVALLFVEGQRAGLEDNQTLLGAGDEAGLALHHLVEHRGGGNRSNDDVGLARDFSVGLGDRAAGRVSAPSPDGVDRR